MTEAEVKSVFIGAQEQAWWKVIQGMLAGHREKHILDSQNASATDKQTHMSVGGTAAIDEFKADLKARLTAANATLVTLPPTGDAAEQPRK